MEKFEQQPYLNKKINKLDDWLPGKKEGHYLKEDKEWPGLEERIGEPRILNNVYFPEVSDWIKKEYENNPNVFFYFEAGCGHGNDLRAIRKELGKRGRFLGVDISKAEIMHGMEFYQQRDNEKIEESRRLFAQGDLRDLKHIYIWDSEKEDFSQSAEIKDGEFDLIYMEAVLHGLGHAKKTHQEKKESAQQMLNELYRICKTGGRFFGRANTFGPAIAKEQQLELLRRTNNWHFIPESGEFEKMLKQAGFTDIKKMITPHEKAGKDQSKKGILRFSFLGKK